MIFRFRKPRASSAGPEFLVVGLGNPGNKYAFTRHNAGFLCADALAEKLGVKINRIRFKSLICDVRIGGKRCLLMKPQTFMNNSGEAVREAADFYKIAAENVLVISDDISLPLGTLRIRRNGSDGGQKGLRSIILHLNSDNFPRIKIGIGAKPHPEMDTADWVLSVLKKDELACLRPVAEKAGQAVELIVNGDVEKAMALFN
ncbi:MAG: aminoacyl-tRNA hydrolase [Acutalibacteraceae bacterium]